MKYALIEGGVVVDAIEVDGLAVPDWVSGMVQIPDGVGIGWTFDGTDYAEPDGVVEPPLLSEQQWQFLLDFTGFRDMLDAALAAMPKTTPEERAQWAGMKAVAYGSGTYAKANALALTATVGALGLPGVTVPTEAEIDAAWSQAAAFQGAASL